MSVSNTLDRNTVGHILAGSGIDAWGIAANTPRLNGAPPLPVAISLVMCIAPAALAGVQIGSTSAYRQEWSRLNKALDTAATVLVDNLVRRGYAAQRVPATISDYRLNAGDGDTDSSASGDAKGDANDVARDAAGDNDDRWRQFPHKTAATLAGLGWIGKTGLFVSHEFGPAVRLATVFTDLSLTPGSPVTTGRCGSCRLCVDHCPAGSGRDVTWHAGMARDELFDAASCQRFRRESGEICGMCVAVCPYSRQG
jgi:epoxyqueuosine reductase QueG